MTDSDKNRQTMPLLDIDEDSKKTLGFLEPLLVRVWDLGLLTLPKQYHLKRTFVEILAVDNDSMRRLNHRTRGKDSSTDVLSFPLCYDDLHIESCVEFSADYLVDSINGEDSICLCLGSIAINTELAQLVAQKLRHSLEDEITLLFIHGLLHILGYDHEVDNGEQRAIEQEIIESLGLGESLIVRSE